MTSELKDSITRVLAYLTQYSELRASAKGSPDIIHTAGDALLLASDVDRLMRVSAMAVTSGSADLQPPEAKTSSNFRTELWGIHVSHCCVIHGCKYGKEYCPVQSAELDQEHPCEQCSDTLNLDRVPLVIREGDPEPTSVGSTFRSTHNGVIFRKDYVSGLNWLAVPGKLSHGDGAYYSWRALSSLNSAEGPVTPLVEYFEEG